MIVPPSSGVPTPAELENPLHAKAWKAAQEFEAMALGQMLQPMFATLDQTGGALGGGSAEGAWRPMLTDEMAKSLARHGGLGLAAPVYRQMLLAQEGPKP